MQILFREPGWQESVNILEGAKRRLFSVASLIEAQAVASKDKQASAQTLLERVDYLVSELDLDIVPLTRKQSRIAREAYLTYGRGQGHKANLNYGDVMSYAVAKDSGEKLAFVGDDFQHTDLKVLRLPV